MDKQKRVSMRILFLLMAGLMCWTGSTWAQDRNPNDQKRIAALIGEMKTADLESLQPITVQPFVLPTASVDVMRVKLEETYEVKGIGTDTVQLHGWIAVTHDNPRPARGETEIRWGTAISQTKFVAMDLKGESNIFGPVHVELTPGVQSIGEVGKLDLSLVDSMLLNIAYMPYRPAGGGDAVASTVPEQVQPDPVPSAHVVPAALVSEEPTTAKGGQAAVKHTLLAVLGAISEKDTNALLSHYSKSTENMFFNGSLASPAKGGEEYVKELGKMFGSIKTIRAIPDEQSIHIKVSGSLASASLTGHNDVVDNEGNRGTGSWAWTVQLEKEKSGWIITHDQFMFAGGAAEDLKAMRSTVGKCVANASVSINMPKLNLHMQTEHPVMWYSEVETIPPVGYTASVSFTPTPLIAEGRQVATLTSGVVKFREVVRRVPLQGTQPGEIKMVANR